MKLPLFLSALFFSVLVNAQVLAPSMSPSAYVKQTIGLTEITIEYSRPSARKRKIFNEEGLLPYKEVWRTGANAATKFSFSGSVNLDGQELPEGSYTLLSTPGKDNWKINWYTYDESNWNTYVDKTPLFTMEIPVKPTASHVETFEIHFRNIALSSASLVMEWERTSIEIPVTVNEKERILQSIDRTLAGPGNFDYFQAALYLHESGSDLNKALEYIQKVTKADDALFFQVSREVMILRDLGRNKEAVTAAKRGLALSIAAENNDFIRLNQKVIQDLRL